MITCSYSRRMIFADFFSVLTWQKKSGLAPEFATRASAQNISHGLTLMFPKRAVLASFLKFV